MDYFYADTKQLAALKNISEGNINIYCRNVTYVSPRVKRNAKFHCLNRIITSMHFVTYVVHRPYFYSIELRSISGVTL
jgi:glucose-6-phosphate 1-dehydrogenase